MTQPAMSPQSEERREVCKVCRIPIWGEGQDPATGRLFYSHIGDGLEQHADGTWVEPEGKNDPEAMTVRMLAHEAKKKRRPPAIPTETREKRLEDALRNLKTAVWKNCGKVRLLKMVDELETANAVLERKE